MIQTEMKSSNQFVFMTGPPTHTTNATMLEFSNLVISLFQQMVATEQVNSVVIPCLKGMLTSSFVLAST